MKIETFADAAQVLAEIAAPIGIEHISLTEAYDRVLAEDITAAIPVPSFARSAYDGYALRATDTLDASEDHPVTLEVTEVVPAGYTPAYEITAGKAARVMTGAPVPIGADAIIMHEKTTFTDTQVTLSAPVSAGNIVPVGEDVTEGTLLLQKGALLSASDIALMAGQGMTEVPVYRKPVIGIISTGTELTDAGNPLEYGKIYNTNPFLIGGYLKKYHVTPNIIGTAPDDLDSLCEAVSSALTSNDMVITTGGVSAGDFDYMPKVVEQIGAKLLFHRVKFKPGGAMLAAEKDGKLILGLSGNPGAAATALLCVGFPSIKRLCGCSDLEFKKGTAILELDLKKKSPVTRLMKGYSSLKDGKLYFTPLDNQRNGSVSSMKDADLIAIVPAGSSPLPAGTELEIFIL